MYPFIWWFRVIRRCFAFAIVCAIIFNSTIFFFLFLYEVKVNWMRLGWRAANKEKKSDATKSKSSSKKVSEARTWKLIIVHHTFEEMKKKWFEINIIIMNAFRAHWSTQPLCSIQITMFFPWSWRKRNIYNAQFFWTSIVFDYYLNWKYIILFASKSSIYESSFSCCFRLTLAFFMEMHYLFGRSFTSVHIIMSNTPYILFNEKYNILFEYFSSFLVKTMVLLTSIRLWLATNNIYNLISIEHIFNSLISI